MNDEIYSFYIKFAQKRFLGAIIVLAKVINRERIRPNMKKILHTPEGVRDIYNEEYEKKVILENELCQVLKNYGYHSIQTPTFEFFDIFGKEIGTTPSNELYKFFDREGNTLVLRPDMTPSIARAVAKYFMDEDMPIRLSYIGNTFINNSSYQGRLKESTQLGAELIGDATVQADAEILAMVVESLKAAGLKDFQIGVGHANYFQGLLEAAQINEEDAESLKTLILNKNFFGVEEYVDKLALSEDLKKLFSLLGNLDASINELKDASTLAKPYPLIAKALDNLIRLSELLELYDINRYVSMELGIVSTYQYYTGIIFAGYTFGSGEAVVKGGRYDKLLTYFGKEAASIGFTIVVDQLMAALTRQKIDIPLSNNGMMVVYTLENQEAAIQMAKALRMDGTPVELLLFDATKTKDDYQAYAKRNRITSVTFLED